MVEAFFKFDLEIVQLGQRQKKYSPASLLKVIYLCSKFQVLTSKDEEVMARTKFGLRRRKSDQNNMGDIILDILIY